MGYNYKILIITVLFSSGLILIISSCKEETEPPVVITEKVKGITTTGAVSGGNIASEGGSPVSSRGVCWNTTTNPTIDNFKTVDGKGAGSYSSNLADLQPGTLYYLKAYATNKAGTTYGFETAFTTIPITPVLSTAEVTDITTNSVICGGNITSDRGLAVTARGVCWSSDYEFMPTLEDPHTNDGSGVGSFISSITGLEPDTRYCVRSYATNSGGTAYGNPIVFLTYPELGPIVFNPELTYGTVTDIDNNTYKTIQIGTQTWMAENLKSTRLNDGTPITYYPDDSEWGSTESPAYTIWYNGFYGAIYNLWTVNTEKLCPTGWHVPSGDDLTILTEYLGGEEVAGGKLKETGTDHWRDPNEGATNSSGFTALPGGYSWAGGGSVTGVGTYGRWWVGSIGGIFVLWNSTNTLSGMGCMSSCGMSVRCIKDE